MIEKILERLEAELKLADEVKEKCARENPLMFDNAKGYSTGIANAKYIVQEVAKEYDNASDTDLTVVSALPSLYPLQPFEEEAIHKVVASAKEYDWIPVEQKLPEDFMHVYATCISLIDDRKPWVTEGVYHSVIGFKGLAPMLSMKNAVVTAWMPKKYPAPYQKECVNVK